MRTKEEEEIFLHSTGVLCVFWAKSGGSRV